MSLLSYILVLFLHLWNLRSAEMTFRSRPRWASSSSVLLNQNSQPDYDHKQDGVFFFGLVCPIIRHGGITSFQVMYIAPGPELETFPHFRPLGLLFQTMVNDNVLRFPFSSSLSSDNV
jgi:hypothetical protein